MRRVEREASDPGRSERKGDPLVQLDELGQARDRRPGIALDLRRACAMAEHEYVRRRAVDQAEGDAAVRGVHERALALDEEQLAASPAAFDDETLRRSGEEVGDDGVDCDPPARDRDSGLAGWHEDGLQAPAARLEVELERDGLLADRAVGTDGEDNPRRDLEVLAGGHVQAFWRAAKVAELDVVLARQLGELGVVCEELVEAVLDVEPGLDALLQEGAPGRREAAALGRDADERGRRLQVQRLVDRREDRHPVEALAGARRVDDGHGGVGRVADDAAGGLAVVRVAGATLSEYAIPLLGHTTRAR